MILESIQLSGLAAVRSGGGAPQDPDAFSEDGYPFVRAGSLAGLLAGASEDSLEKIEPATARKHGLQLFPQGTVMFAKSGMSATKGLVYRLRGPAYVVNHLAALVPHDPRDGSFVEHALKRFPPTRLIRDPAYPSIRLGDIEQMSIQAPPSVDDRVRISSILERADGLCMKRKDAMAKLDTLAQSTFLQMFGNPIADGWEMQTIADVASDRSGAIRTGPFGSQLLHSEFTESGVAVLGIDNAVDNEFRWGERRFISEQKYRKLARYTVRPGDVLITIMGTCGRCAIVPDDIPLAINTKHLCCITLDEKKCLPTFLHAYFLSHPIARRYLAQKAKGAIMEGLNMGIIKGMPIPLAPIHLQEKFNERLRLLNELRDHQRLSEARLESLRASLQYHAFRGEL